MSDANLVEHVFEIKHPFEPLEFVGRSHNTILKIPGLFRIRKSKDRQHNCNK